jgi:DNA polymerase-3 subunit gamma/tau
MSYLVLARRWRPQKFADLVGQDVVVRTLKNALVSGNLAHAYLLCGIRGVGKTTIARLMAMAANCEHPTGGEPCGECAACQSIASGSNLDVQEMDAASHTGVDDVREILDGVRYPPSSLKTKVYIIDEAHMLSKSAFNALLKTLEEPPAHVLFILATTETEKLPLTVRSRCQRFDLRRLGQVEISDYLNHIFSQEKIGAETDAVAALARAADGSVRDALSLAERVLAYTENQLTLEDVQAALGMVGSELVRSLSQAIFAGDAMRGMEVMRSAVSAGHGPRTLLLELASLWHQLACLQVDSSLTGQQTDADQRIWLEQNAASLTAQALDLRYQVLLHGIRDLALVDERMGAEMLLMRLSGLNVISAVTPPSACTTDLPGAVSVGCGSAVVESAQPVPEAIAQPQPAEPVNESHAADKLPDLPLYAQSKAAGKVFSSWQQAVEAFGEINVSLSGRLDNIICLEFADKVRLVLSKHQQQAIATVDRLAFAEWLGREVFWESQQGQGGESLSQERARQGREEKVRLRQNAERDPHVQALIKEMDAQLVKVLPAGVEEQAGDER